MRTVSRLVFLLVALLGLTGCPAALAAFGLAAPVVTAAIDAYTAHARAVVPELAADSPIVVELARLFAEDDRCRAAVVALPVVAGPVAPSDAALVAKALDDSASASKALLAYVEAARAPATSADAGPLLDSGPPK
jgi:hypothetical protein